MAKNACHEYGRFSQRDLPMSARTTTGRVFRVWGCLRLRNWVCNSGFKNFCVSRSVIRFKVGTLASFGFVVFFLLGCVSRRLDQPRSRSATALNIAAKTMTCTFLGSSLLQLYYRIPQNLILITRGPYLTVFLIRPAKLGILLPNAAQVRKLCR